jgi:hypothetical protein
MSEATTNGTGGLLPDLVAGQLERVVVRAVLVRLLVVLRLQKVAL